MKYNPFKHAKQLVKSQALADELYGCGLTSEIAPYLTNAEWVQVANLAGCNPPKSDECRAMVVAALLAREKADAKMGGRKFARLAS